MNMKRYIYFKYNNKTDLLIDILSDILDDGYDAEELAEVVKSDNTLYQIYRNECLQFNMLKVDKEFNLNTLFC